MTSGDGTGLSAPESGGNRAQRRAAGRRSKKMMAVTSGAVLVAGVAGPGVLLSQSVASAATPIVVDSLEDDGTGGTTLREAIVQANTDVGLDVITFQSGLSGTIELLNDLDPITESVDIQGPGAEVITVDGDGNAMLKGSTLSLLSSLAVSGLTLTGGYSINNGGALEVDPGISEVSLDSLVIIGNESEDSGGGVAFVDTNAEVTITNSVISGNIANSGGGGLWARGYSDDDRMTLIIENSTISGNTAVDYYGGGLYVDTTDLTLVSSTVADNTSTYNGGGLYLRDSSGVIENSTISGNVADDDGGGGVSFGSGLPGDSLVIRNSTVSGNMANGYGGGLYLAGEGATVIENSTISGNSANQGGAIYSGAGHSLTIVQSTITDNDAGGPAEPAVGGVQLFGLDVAARSTSNASSQPEKADRVSRPAAAAPGELEVVGTILAGNSGQDIGIFKGMSDGGDPSVTSDHSILGTVDEAIVVTDVGGTQFDVTDPGVAPLASNGGPTQTHALLDGSVALDAGPDPVPSFPGNEYDQRGPGFARVAFGFVDVGAFEAQEDEPVVPPPAPEPDAGPADAILVTPAFTG